MRHRLHVERDPRAKCLQRTEADADPAWCMVELQAIATIQKARQMLACVERQPQLAAPSALGVGARGELAVLDYRRALRPDQPAGRMRVFCHVRPACGERRHGLAALSIEVEHGWRMASWPPWPR
eukprot:6519602-Prymnesium_polylepis.1